MGYSTMNGDDFASPTRSGAVSKSDTTVLDFNAIWIGTTGDVTIKHTETGAASTFKNVPAGAWFIVAGVRVMTLTSASDMVWGKW